MHIEYLQYLVEVSNNSSISAAAQKLYLSQTSLSAIIASLEKDLSLTFFRRTHKGITVTPEGKAALEIIKDILEKNEQLRNLANSHSAINQFVNIAVYPSAANGLSVYLARQCAEKYPDVSLQIHKCPYNTTFNAIQDGVSRIAVVAENSKLISTHQEMVKHGLEIETLYQDHFCLICSSEFRMADRESLDVSELLNDRLAFTHAFPSSKDRVIGPVIRKFSNLSIFDNVETVKQVVAANDAIALIPGIALQDDYRIESGAIRRIPVTGFDTELTNYLLYERYSMLSVAERAVLEEIRSYYRKLSANGRSDRAPR